MHFKHHMLDGLYVVGGGVASRRRRSPERRTKASGTHTAYSSPLPHTYKNVRPRLGLTTTLSGKPSASSIPSSSTPASLLPNIGEVPLGNNWAFAVKGVPKALHGNLINVGEQSSGGPPYNVPLSAPQAPAKRKVSNDELTADATYLAHQQLRNSQNSSVSPRAKSAPNMNELNDLSITSFSLTTRGIIACNEQQNAQRYTLPSPSPSQMFDEPKEDGVASTSDDAAKLPQTPRSKQGQKLNKSNAHLTCNFECKLERIRNILDKSPEYDGPIRYSPSELRPSQQLSKSKNGFDKLLIMRQIPKQERNQRHSPRSSNDSADSSGNHGNNQAIVTTTSQHGSHRERSMILELNSLSRKHAAKSIRSLGSKDPAFESSQSQPMALQVTSSVTVPKEEVPKNTLVNDWLGEGEGKKKIVLNVPNTNAES